MFDKPQTLEVSKEDFDVIEAALHTQSQILNVQASAGGQGARERLNAVKRILSTLSQQRPTKQSAAQNKPCRPSTLFQRLGWSQPS